MKRTDIYSYFCFGYNYYLLRYESKGVLVHGDKDSLISRIEDFLKNVEDLNLQVTSKAAEQLRTILQEIAAKPSEAKVDVALATQVTSAIDALDKTLDAELQLRYAFIVTPKRFGLDNLLEHPVTLFAGEVFQLLPRICQFDIAQACRCIAFGLPTAAAFHLMRGTEGVLRFYYEALVKRGRVGHPMWGPIVEHLRKRRDAPQLSLLDHLDHIRTNFRNPTQHPEARYDLDEAQDLLSLTIDAINRMVRDLRARGLARGTSAS
ncbi:MAG: hypothetical protein AB1427_20890 [Thermodesulfobacteriota bacterium]